MSTQQQTTVLESIVSQHNNDSVSTITDMSNEICGIHINDQYLYQPRNGEWIWYIHHNNDDVQSVSIFFTSVSCDDNEDVFLRNEGTTSAIIRSDDFSETFYNLLKEIADNTA